MRNSLLVIALVAASTGCIMPETARSSIPIERRLSQPVLDRVGALEVTSKRDGAAVAITAKRTAQCHRDIHQITRVQTTTRRHLVGGGALTTLLVIIYPVGLGALALSLVANAASPNSQSEELDEKVGVQTSACRIPASQLALRIWLPSGAMLEGLTDAHGTLAIVLPEGEPAGDVQVDALEEIELSPVAINK